MDLEPEAPPVAEEPARDVNSLAVLVAQTVAGLQGSASGAVTASTLKRTLLRKDSTFTESDYGFRTFGELLRHLAERNVVELADGPAKGDPEVSLPEYGDREDAFTLLRSVVLDGAGSGRASALSGLKTSSDGYGRTSARRRSSATAASCSSARRPPPAEPSNCTGAPEADDYLLTATP
jgi:hypothetical protein